MSIFFFYEDVDFKLRNVQLFRNWLKSVFELEEKSFDNLNYIFCSDEYLHQMNVAYLRHDTLTDIITFDTSEPDQNISGDLFISIDRVWENASVNSAIFENELRRVIVHGALHLIGYKDKTSAQKSKIRFLEDKYIGMFPVKR